MSRLRFRRAILGVALAAGVALAMPSQATLILTAAGQSLGFAATTAISGLPAAGGPPGLGPIGLAAAGGRIFVYDISSTTRYVFNDVDGQTVADATSSRPSNVFNPSFVGYATLGTTAYGSENGAFVQFNADGSIGRTVTSLFASGGMAGNPVSGKLIATIQAGRQEGRVSRLVEIDPVANTFRIIANNVFGFGLALTPDGQTAYVAQTGAIIGYDIASGAQVFDSGFLSGFPLGMAVVSSTNALNGFVIVNFADGHVGLIDPTTLLQTVIGQVVDQAGFYAAPDFTNGTVLLDFSTEVDRLSCGVGCAIGSAVPVPVPEPEALVLMMVGLIGLVAQRSRRRDRSQGTLEAISR